MPFDVSLKSADCLVLMNAHTYEETMWFTWT